MPRSTVPRSTSPRPAVSRAPSPAASRRPGPRAGSSYWALSRAPRYSLLFALPLLVAYEGLAALLGDVAGASVRNGADVWVKAPFVALFGPRGPVVFGALLVGGSAALVWRDVRRARDGVRAGVLLRMLLESAALAVVCGVVVGAAAGALVRALPHAFTGTVLVPRALHGAALLRADGGVAHFGGAERLMLSLGAGLYEELLFRVVLVGALAALGRRVLGLAPGAAGTLAVVLGALLFSAAHYVGPYGDRLTLASFTFRALAGLFFSALYLLRGFGIAAWTHALYDVGVLAVGGG